MKLKPLLTLLMLVIAVINAIVLFDVFNEKSTTKSKISTPTNFALTDKTGFLRIDTKIPEGEICKVKILSHLQSKNWAVYKITQNESKVIELKEGLYNAVAEVNKIKESITFEIAADATYSWFLNFEKLTTLICEITTETDVPITDAIVQAVYLGDNIKYKLLSHQEIVGKYKLDNISAGKYLIQVTSKNYLPESRVVSVVPGAENAFKIKLTKGKILNIRIVDENSNPVFQPIFLTCRRIIDTFDVLTVEVTKSAISMSNFTVGEYILSVNSENYIESHTTVAFQDADTEKNVVVQLSQGKSIYGFVYDNSGIPLKKAKVTLEEMIVTEGALENVYRNEKVIITDESGKFSFESAKTDYKLTFAHNRFLSKHVKSTDELARNLPMQIFLESEKIGFLRVINQENEIIPNAQLNILFSDLKKIELVTTKYGQAEVPLKAQGLIEIRISASGYRNQKLVFTHQELLQHAQVIMEKSAKIILIIHDEQNRRIDCEDVQTSQICTIERRRDESWILSDLSDSKITLEITASGFVAKKVKLTVPSAGSIKTHKIQLDAGSSIAGIIYDNKSKVLPAAQVYASYQIKGKYFFQKATSDDNGEFKIAGLEEGEITLKITAKGFLSKTENINISQNSKTKILKIILSKGRKLMATVKSESGNSLSDFSFSLKELETENEISIRRYNVVEGAGVLEISGVPLKSFDFYIIKSGYKLFHKIIAAGTGNQVLKLDVVLTPGRILTGKVTTVEGVAIKQAFVLVKFLNAPGGTSAISDETGSLFLKGISDGKVKIIAQTAKFAFFEKEFLISQATTEIKIVLLKSDLVKIVEVTKGSHAEKAGFQAGDVIRKIDGAQISSIATLNFEMQKPAKSESREILVEVKNSDDPSKPIVQKILSAKRTDFAGLKLQNLVR